MRLDPTYTAKTFAAVLDYCRKHGNGSGPVLYWHTYNSVDLSKQAQSVQDRELPQRLQPFMRTNEIENKFGLRGTMRTQHIIDTDIIVVGSGPGGATVSRELARRGRKVLLLERGYDHRSKFYYGTYLGALRYTDRMSLLFTEEGLNIIAPIMVGGATGMYTGCSALPPPWLKSKYGIDLDTEAQATVAELKIEPLPPHLRGQASTRIAKAGQGLGYQWFAQPKFMNPERCKAHGRAFDCQATCMLGCTCRAKWNAAEWVDDAVAHGALLKTSARVKKY